MQPGQEGEPPGSAPHPAPGRRGRTGEGVDADVPGGRTPAMSRTRIVSSAAKNADCASTRAVLSLSQCSRHAAGDSPPASAGVPSGPVTTVWTGGSASVVRAGVVVGAPVPSAVAGAAASSWSGVRKLSSRRLSPSSCRIRVPMRKSRPPSARRTPPVRPRVERMTPISARRETTFATCVAEASIAFATLEEVCRRRGRVPSSVSWSAAR
ncbi:hypothetical protein MTQ19_01890 [Corynebacterium bovis]